MKVKKTTILTTLLSFSLIFLIASKAEAQAWTYTVPADGRIDAGALIDVDIPGVAAPDIVVLGVYAKPSSIGGLVIPEGTYAIGLNAFNGQPVFQQPIDTNSGILSVQALGDINGDNVEEALIAVKNVPTSAAPGNIIYYTINGFTGQLIGADAAILDVPVKVPTEFLPIRGDFNGDGIDNNKVIRSIYFADPSDGPSALRAF